jgi:polyhydroxyalkanoate synthesis repressor PhaR
MTPRSPLDKEVRGPARLDGATAFTKTAAQAFFPAVAENLTMTVIKRYSNRKLYDTERSCYVTLEEIATMVRGGEEVRIVDNKSGEDLTTVTLAQILYEEEKRERRILPLQSLRMIIQSPGEYLQRLSRPVTEFREQTQAQVEKLRKKAEAQQEEFVAPMREFVENVQKTFDEIQTRFDHRMKDTVETMTQFPDIAGEIERINKRLDGVEKSLSELRTTLDRMADDHGDRPARGRLPSSNGTTRIPRR